MKTKTWALVLVLLLGVCAALSFWLLRPGENAARVEIWSEGELKYTLSLRVDQTITVDAAAGSNTVTILGGAVAVTQADCPDHYCMQRGYCSGGSDIICLPNRLVIRFVSETEIDGVAG